MAKANLILPNGTKVTIEGVAEEVATILSHFSSSGEEITAAAKQAKRKNKAKSAGTPRSAIPKRKGPQIMISELAAEGYFKSKRTIGDIQRKLEEKGHIYAQTSLSTPLLRLTRNHTLRRLKEKSGWVYVS